MKRCGAAEKHNVRKHTCMVQIQLSTFCIFICGNEMQKKKIPREESASKSCFLKDV